MTGGWWAGGPADPQGPNTSLMLLFFSTVIFAWHSGGGGRLFMQDRTFDGRQHFHTSTFFCETWGADWEGQKSQRWDKGIRQECFLLLLSIFSTFSQLQQRRWSSISRFFSLSSQTRLRSAAMLHFTAWFYFMRVLSIDLRFRVK